MGPKGAAQRFIHIANSRGGRDNITAVVISVQ
jgi:serine/threonine protein phosphatase PrpC